MMNCVEIRGEDLLKICRDCKEVRVSYDVKSNFTIYKKWSWKKFKKIEVKLFYYPRWATPHSGVDNRLNNLELMAKNVYPEEKIYLTETTYSNLIKLRDKRDGFQVDIFAIGY